MCLNGNSKQAVDSIGEVTNYAENKVLQWEILRNAIVQYWNVYGWIL